MPTRGDGVYFHIIYNNFPKIADNMSKKVPRIVAKAALDIEAGAKVRAPVRSGDLRRSIAARKISDDHWRVTVGMDYGIYVEMGTRHMAAQPYLQPAVDAVRAGFLQALKGAIR